MSSCGLWPASASSTNDFLSAGSTTSSSTGRTTHGYIVRIQKYGVALRQRIIDCSCRTSWFLSSSRSWLTLSRKEREPRRKVSREVVALQSAFLFALSALCTFSASALAALIDVSSAWMTNSALGYLSCVFRSAFW